MPPKDSKKVKVEKAEAKVPATPEKQKAKPKSDTPKKDTPARKKSDATLAFKSLPGPFPDASPLPVEIAYDGDSNHASQGKKGDYQKYLKLSAANTFQVSKTLLIKEGEYQGYQVIYLKPAKAFKFGELPEEVRNRVYRYYFACKGVVDEPIVFDGKRSANKEAYAKTYAAGSKNRVALLATNKEISQEAISILYAKTLRVDTTQTLIDVLGQLEASRTRLRSIEVKTFNKVTARNALHFLAEAKNIRRLHFDAGVFAEADPKKAAKAFYECSFRFLKNVNGPQLEEGEERDDAAGVEVLSFGKGAFTLKDDKKVVKNWEDGLVEEFKEELRKKLR